MGTKERTDRLLGMGKAQLIMEAQDQAIRIAELEAQLSAVLEAQKGQEPVAWAYTINNSHSVFSAEKPPADAYDEGTLYPLFAAPVEQPDMVRVPREPTDAMIEAAMNRYKHVSPEAKARYIQMQRENFRCDYKAMIAAAEGKSNANLSGLPLGKD